MRSLLLGSAMVLGMAAPAMAQYWNSNPQPVFVSPPGAEGMIVQAHPMYQPPQYYQPPVYQQQSNQPAFGSAGCMGNGYGGTRACY